jgi:hypothetical protein
MKNRLAIQQLVAVMGSWLFLCMIVLYLVLVGARKNQTPNALSNIGMVLSPLCLGYWMSAKLPRGTRGGRWMFILPVGIFVIILVWTGFNFSWQQAGKEFFSFSGRGEDALGAVIFTIPVCSSIFYSIGAALRLLNESRQRRATVNG